MEAVCKSGTMFDSAARLFLRWSERQRRTRGGTGSPPDDTGQGTRERRCQKSGCPRIGGNWRMSPGSVLTPPSTRRSKDEQQVKKRGRPYAD